ncbi:MAG TPA: nuclear transport factor 2 family protein [Ktedonobacteraceae bacterium]|nr:nuclear transport factor 2 family protein [Ktedonobacteraceae bacterium]HEV2662998.1 nuclear transport factor 2 family protein [Ktedonobacteraceae bacterium]
MMGNTPEENTPADSVRAFIAALEANEQETAADFLTDDFMATGWTPQPLDKGAFMTVIGGLKSGIPGLMFNMHNIEEDGAVIHATFKIAGYQTDSFSLPPLSLPPIPQMARSISMPAEDVSFTFINEKIKLMNVKPTRGGGISGLLHQLGFDAPIIQ